MSGEIGTTTGWNSVYGQDESSTGVALRESWRVVSGRAGSDLIGVGRPLSDNVQCAVILDMVVDPQWRGRGTLAHRPLL